MSDGFGTNLLSQVTALDRKLSISRDRENLNRNNRHYEQRKHADSPPAESPGSTPGEDADIRRTVDDTHGIIDITI